MAKIFITLADGKIQSCYSDIGIDVLLIDFDNFKEGTKDFTEETLKNNTEMLELYDSGQLKEISIK